jgi:uncharacterized protein YbjT (DUF2867 family)
MPKPITVLVAGATGKQGGAAARLLLDRGHRVRALTRIPKSAAADDLRSLGAEVLAGDLEDPISIERAARGADAFFLMATPMEKGPEAELRAARSSARAAKEAGVKHLVYSSAAGTDWVTGVPIVDSKRKVELYIQELGVPYTIVAPAFFMENLLGPMFLEELRHGTLSMPLPGTRKLQMVAISDIAGLVRAAIERPSELQGKRIEIASDELTGPEIASVLSHAARSPIGFAQDSLASVRARSEDLALLWGWLDRVGFDVDIRGLAHEYPEVGWHTLGAWAREQDFSGIDVAAAEQPTA